MQLNKIETHKDNINLTGTLKDNDLDKISYRILLNDHEILLWSQFESDPYIDYIFNYKQFNINENVIEVEYKDNYKFEGLGKNKLY